MKKIFILNYAENNWPNSKHENAYDNIDDLCIILKEISIDKNYNITNINIKIMDIFNKEEHERLLKKNKQEPPRYGVSGPKNYAPGSSQK